MNNIRINKDSSQTIFNILSQVILNGTNFILIMLFTRHLSTANYGIVSIYQAYVLFFAVLVGLSTQGSIGVAFAHIDRQSHSNYLASIFTLSEVAFLLICIICALFQAPLSRFSQLEPPLLALMLFHSFGNFCFQFMNTSFIFSRRAQYSCLLGCLVAVLMIAISWASIVYPIDDSRPYLGRILGLAIPYILCIICALVYVYRKGNPFAELKRFWVFCLPICIPLIFHGFSHVVLAQTDKIMLQKITMDNGVVGVYSFFVTFVHILNALYMALNNTWVPIYYGYTKNNDISSIKKRALKYHAFFSIMMIGFICVAPEFVKLFADSKYWGGMKLIPIVVLSVYMVFMYSFAVNYELYHRQTKWVALGTSAAALVNIILNAVLIPVWGMYGAAIATLGAYTLLYVFHELCAEKIIKPNKYPYHKFFFAKDTLMVFLVAVGFYLVEDLWIIRWSVAIFAGIYLLYIIYKEKTLF